MQKKLKTTLKWNNLIVRKLKIKYNIYIIYHLLFMYYQHDGSYIRYTQYKISIAYEIYYLLKHNHDTSIQVETELQKYQCFLKRFLF